MYSEFCDDDLNKFSYSQIATVYDKQIASKFTNQNDLNGSQDRVGRSCQIGRILDETAHHSLWV